METLIVGLLIFIAMGLLVVGALVGWNIYLTYRTLIRPEAPCYAGSAMMSPRLGMMEVDQTHPAYTALSKMIAKDKGKDEKVKADNGNYL